MSVNIGQSISNGIDRTMSTTGFLVASLFFLIQFGSSLISATPVLAESTLEQADSLVVWGLVGGVLLFGLGLAVIGAIVQLGAARLLTRTRPELSRIETDAFTRNVVFGTLSLIVAEILSGIAVGIGFVFLVVPGLFLLVSFLFTPVVVAVEDRGPIEALSRSWNLAAGNRWQLFAIGVVVFFIYFIISIPFAILSVIPVVGQIANGLLSGFFQTALLAIIAEIYVVLTKHDSARTQSVTGSPGEQHTPDDSSDSRYSTSFDT